MSYEGTRDKAKGVTFYSDRHLNPLDDFCILRKLQDAWHEWQKGKQASHLVLRIGHPLEGLCHDPQPKEKIARCMVV